MNLIIDIGNTFTKLAVFKNGQEISFSKYESLTLKVLEETRSTCPGIKNIIVSAVKDDAITNEIKHLYNNVYILEEKTPLPITLEYNTIETLGKDRIAAVAGANVLFPGENLLVIDAGTALTIDFIDKNGIYKGGNISPGLNTRFKALHHFTGKLPLVKFEENAALTAKSTKQAINSGVWFGMIYEIQGYINDYKTSYGEIKTILTGGDAIYFVEKLKNSIFVVFNLNMIGLNRILDYNAIEN